MFLNYRRSAVKYIFAYIFTLGIYHFIFKRAVTDDTNKACGGEPIQKPGAVYVLLYIVTLGIYGVIFDLKLIKKWNEYLNEKGIYSPIDPNKYFSLAVVPFVRVIAVPKFINASNLVFRVYSELQFADDEDGEYFVRTVSKIKADAEEKRLAGEEANVAGMPVIEEYDFEKDTRRAVFKAEEIPAEPVVAASAESQIEEPAEPEEPQEAPESFFRNRKWFVRVFSAMLAVFMLPVLTVLVTVFFLPPVYADTFVGELGEKYDRLCSIDDPKIVVIGGSSVAFGLDSAMMEEKLGMPVVNFGLYANLGTKLMMDLSKANINKGDIIVLAPEMNSQTLSLYFNSETAMQALDGNMRMLFRVGSDNHESLLGASWKFANDKLHYLVSGKRPANEGAYKKENFNEYGDNVYDRPYNVMTENQNTITLDFRTNYEDSIDSEYEQYIAYVNDYVKYAERRGATVYFSFSPMNAAAMSSNLHAEDIYAFYRNLCASLDCRVISNVNDYIMDEGYFFDSEFHLNNAGVVVRTVKLIDDIKREIGRGDITMDILDLPEPPGYKPSDIVDGDEENLYFLLELVEGAGETYYKVVGLNDAGKSQSELKIPKNVDGIPVRSIGENVFFGCNALTKLTLGENINAISGRAFNGASSLVSVIIPEGKKADDISVPNNMSDALMTEGCNPALKFYVDEPFYTGFIGDYFWGDYGTMIAVK